MENNESDLLVDLACSGDAAALAKLLGIYRERLKRMIVNSLDPRLSARVDASDVLQETLADAARRIPAYSDDRTGGFYPWLRQIAKDRLIDIHRKHIWAEKRSVMRENRLDSFISSASASRLVDRLSGSQTSPSQNIERKEMHEKIVNAINRLSTSSREILLMRFDEQMTVDEIARVWNLSASAVKSRLWRAIEKLNQVLAERQWGNL